MPSLDPARPAAILVAVLALAYALAYPPASPASASSSPTVTPATLSADLREAARMRRLPANLSPPLASARAAGPAITINGCRLGHAGIWRNPCVYGDRAATTSVVLFGDSHAAMWFPALNLISKQQHWRLVSLIKSGCPPVEVGIAAWFLNGALYSACDQWRAAAMARIAKLHPALVIVTWARWLEEPEARPLDGVPGGYGGAWQDGVAAMFHFLRRAASHVIFISDDPTLPRSAPPCLSQHRLDVIACAPHPSAAVSVPAVRAQELQLAAQAGVSSIDPTRWFCTPSRCPVVVGNLLVYQDNSHMTRQWAQFIAPVLANSVLPVMRG